MCIEDKDKVSKESTVNENESLIWVSGELHIQLSYLRAVKRQYSRVATLLLLGVMGVASL